MDFVSDKLFDGRAVRILTVVDVRTREALSTAAGTDFQADRAVGGPDRPARLRDKPGSVRVDDGPEFAGRPLDRWAGPDKVGPDLSRPGKPGDNAFVTAFPGRLRQERRDASWLLPTADARAHRRREAALQP